MAAREVSIRIESNAVNDPYARYHGLGVDQELDPRFWETQPEKVAGVSAATFVYERKYTLSPFAKHMVVYATSGRYPDYFWNARIFADRILLAWGPVGYNKHLVGSFRIVAGRVVPAIINVL